MKKLIRKLLLWAFKEKFRIYAIQKYVADIEMVKDKLSYEGYIKREIAHSLMQKLLDEGAIEIKSSYTPELVGRKYQARIYVLV